MRAASGAQGIRCAAVVGSAPRWGNDHSCLCQNGKINQTTKSVRQRTLFRFSSGVRNANTILQSQKEQCPPPQCGPARTAQCPAASYQLGAAVLLVVAAALTVIYSLYKIQIRDGATYRQYAAEQQLLDSTIQATRGEIYDTSGITLASTSVVWTIWADPSYSTALYTTTTDQDTKAEIRTIDEAAMKEVCTQITLRLLSGDGESLDSVDTTSAEYQTQYQSVCDALSQNESSYQVLATKVNNAIKLSIEEYVKTYNKAHSKSGKSAGALEKILAKLGLGQQESDDGTPTVRKGRVSVSASKGFQRDYPYGRFAAAVLGFCNADGQGVYGLENSYESTLAGVNGRTITLRNAYGNAIADENATTYAAKDGSNLVLSLDVNIQEVVERYLNEAVAANTVENRGCAIVMNVKTGAILAMAPSRTLTPMTRRISAPIWPT